MKATEAAKAIMVKSGLTTTTLANKMSSQAKNYNARLVNDRLNQNDMTIGKLDEMVRTMGYKILLVPDEPEVDKVLKPYTTYRIF